MKDERKMPRKSVHGKRVQNWGKRNIYQYVWRDTRSNRERQAVLAGLKEYYEKGDSE